mgnify:CR=1 FL=1
MSLTQDQVVDALRPVEDPELRRSIVDLGMVRDVAVSSGGEVSLTVVLTVAGCPLRNEIQSRVDTALRAHADVSSVALTFGVMNDAERENVTAPVQEFTTDLLRGKIARLALDDASPGGLEIGRRLGDTKVDDFKIAIVGEE